MLEKINWNALNRWSTWLGLLGLYLTFSIRWVKKPLHYVVEYNIPGFETRAFTWGPGLHFLWIPIPPLMFVREKIPVGAYEPFKLQLGSNQGLGNPDPVEFSDDSAGVDIQAVLLIPDEESAIKATYKVVDIADLIERQTTPTPDETHLKPYQRATLNHIEAYLRAHLGQVKLDDAIKDTERKKIQDEVRAAVAAKTQDWGVTLVSVAITDFHLSEETLKIRRQLIEATKQVQGEIEIAEGRIKVAEANKTATVTTAQGAAEAARLAGEGEKARLQAIAQAGLPGVQAAAYELAKANMAALERGNTTVIATSEGGNLSQLAGMAGMLKGVLGGGNQTPPPAPVPSPSPAPTPPAPAPQVPLSSRKRGNQN